MINYNSLTVVGTVASKGTNLEEGFVFDFVNTRKNDKTEFKVKVPTGKMSFDVGDVLLIQRAVLVSRNGKLFLGVENSNEIFMLKKKLNKGIKSPEEFI